ncbi:hypothetical protein QJS10_CPA05g01775 [Acorus calamus]|uniref:DUF8040 domain-containing protein n=1 Tax=Acorus calamus TaxID=4465 RepID=A0AAV9EVB3_ACOCL|nr:hypothetical protein QJS10_CPA05g01775 [Acorus calamus]
MKDTRHVSSTEQLVIFLHAIGHGVPNRVLSERFQHSGETISRHFNAGLRAVVELRRTSFNYNKLEWGFIHNAIAAIDGTHIPPLVLKSKASRYRNRKGWTNVMGVCSFNFQFLYIVAGWEGSTADIKVLRWALESGGFHVPQEQVEDAGDEEIDASIPLQFNDINRERSFDVLKKRWPILDEMPNYPYDTQVKIIIATMRMEDALISEFEEDNVEIEHKHMSPTYPTPV